MPRLFPKQPRASPPPSLLYKLRAHEHKHKAQNAPSAHVRIAPSRGQGRKKPTTTKAAVGLVILKFLNPLIFFSSFHSFFIKFCFSFPRKHMQPQGEKNARPRAYILLRMGSRREGSEKVGEEEQERRRWSGRHRRRPVLFVLIICGNM